MRDRPIGIFDSGIGGLTVLREIVELLPHEDTVYFGDTARVPYGTKSRETVTGYAMEVARFLTKTGIKLLVVACNTASAFAIPDLRRTLDIPVVGVIEPGARAAIETTRGKRIGVIGTEGTIKSGAYFDAIKSFDPKALIFTKACPLFVPLVEEGWTDNEVAELAAGIYLRDLKDHGVDALVLGCTHYPLLRKVIARTMGNKVALVDSAEATAVEVSDVLAAKGLLKSRADAAPTHAFCVTDSPERFVSIGRRFFGDDLNQAKLVSLER